MDVAVGAGTAGAAAAALAGGLAEGAAAQLQRVRGARPPRSPDGGAGEVETCPVLAVGAAEALRLRRTARCRRDECLTTHVWAEQDDQLLLLTSLPPMNAPTHGTKFSPRRARARGSPDIVLGVGGGRAGRPVFLDYASVVLPSTM
jgi:hypothetical protein